MVNFAHGDLVTFGAYALVVPSVAEVAKPFIGAGIVSLLYVAGVLDFRMGVPLAIAGFVGTGLGGMGNLWGAMLGGLTLGVFRPQGLVGDAELGDME